MKRFLCILVHLLHVTTFSNILNCKNHAVCSLCHFACVIFYFGCCSWERCDTTTGPDLGKNGSQPPKPRPSISLQPKQSDPTVEFRQFSRGALHECATHEKLDMLPSYIFLYLVVQTLLSGKNPVVDSSPSGSQGQRLHIDVERLQLGELITGGWVMKLVMHKMVCSWVIWMPIP